MALCFGSFMGVLPYCSIMARLYSQRVTRSREGDVLVQELLNNYKIHMYNMKEAIEITAFTIEGAPGAKRILFKSGKRTQQCSNRKKKWKNFFPSFVTLLTLPGVMFCRLIFFCLYSRHQSRSGFRRSVVQHYESRKVIEHGKEGK